MNNLLKYKFPSANFPNLHFVHYVRIGNLKFGKLSIQAFGIRENIYSGVWNGGNLRFKRCKAGFFNHHTRRALMSGMIRNILSMTFAGISELLSIQFTRSESGTLYAVMHGQPYEESETRSY